MSVVVFAVDRVSQVQYSECGSVSAGDRVSQAQYSECSSVSAGDKVSQAPVDVIVLDGPDLSNVSLRLVTTLRYSGF